MAAPLLSTSQVNVDLHNETIFNLNTKLEIVVTDRAELIEQVLHDYSRY